MDTVNGELRIDGGVLVGALVSLTKGELGDLNRLNVAPCGASTAALLPQPSLRSRLTSTPAPSDSPAGREVAYAPPR